MIPINASGEEKRIQELLRYNILDTAEEQEFDDLTKLATYLCDVNYSQINFLDQDRQWTKSSRGWNMKQIPRNESICRFSIQEEQYLVIRDLAEDPRFVDYDYVKDRRVRFYAGVVLNSSRGYPLGTLCVFGETPKELSEQQLESLRILGNEVEARLELRLKREQHQKRAERHFLDQIRLTDQIIKHLPGIYFLIDKSGTVRKWNNNLEDIAYRSEEEVRNRSYREFIVPEDCGKTQNVLEEVFENGHSRTEIRHLSKDGKITPLLLIGIRYTTDRETFVIGIGINITEEKKIQRELEYKERRLEEAQRIGKMGSWTWHIPTNEVSWSDEVYELYGLDRDNYIPSIENFSEMLTEEGRQEVQKIVEDILAGKKWSTVELEVQKPDGSTVIIHERGEVHYDEDGNPVEVSGTMQDVTEQYENEEKIKAALREKEVLLSEIHHRVKNNLAIINGLLQLEIFNTGDETIRNVLSESQLRIHSMALIHEALYSSGDFSKISFGNYIRELTGTLLDTLTKKKNDIGIDLEMEELTLGINQAVPCALIVNELVTNSLKHAFPNGGSGRIALTLREMKNTIYLDIRDNGVGMEPVDMEDPGTLGLTLVRNLIRQIDGTLTVGTEDGMSYRIVFTRNMSPGSSANFFVMDNS